jgi:hypothetical protein
VPFTGALVNERTVPGFPGCVVGVSAGTDLIFCLVERDIQGLNALADLGEVCSSSPRSAYWSSPRRSFLKLRSYRMQRLSTALMGVPSLQLRTSFHNAMVRVRVCPETRSHRRRVRTRMTTDNYCFYEATLVLVDVRFRKRPKCDARMNVGRNKHSYQSQKTGS